MAKPSKAQQETVERVMHAFKHGELRTSGNGPEVRNPKQAVAIALHEAGASNQESPETNRRNLRRTRARDRQGLTELGKRGDDASKAELSAEAKRRKIPGRSSMGKAELREALSR